MIAYTYYESDARVVREAEAALTAGFAVDFLALRRPGDPPIQYLRGVRIFHLAQARYRGGSYLRYLIAYLLFFLRCFLKTSSLFMKRRYQVIHVNNMPDFLVFSTLIAKLLGAKVVLDIHDPMPTVFVSKFRRGERSLSYRILLWQELLSARYADRVVTVNHPVRDVVLAKHGIAPTSVQVIANFPDTSLFAYRPNYRTREQIRFVFHGTIVQRAGLENLIIALSKIQRREKIRVKIIGEGDFSAPLQKLINDYKLEDIVDFDNRSYPVHEIPERISDCDVGVVPLEISSHTNYALPLKLLEYIAVGLPVITVRSVGICHYFKEGDCLFYESNDVESLRRLLEGLIAHPEMLEHYHRAAVTLRDRFSWRAEAKKYVSLLKDLSTETRHCRVRMVEEVAGKE
jgi:glycosyltransferase involved in cell wall biosynthesis